MTDDGWQSVAALDDIAPQGLSDVVVGRELVMLWRGADGTVRAFQGLCPHEFARLAEGTVESDETACWVKCPRHLARFRLGDGVCGPGWVLPPLRRYAVRIAGGKVMLPDPLAPLPA